MILAVLVITLAAGGSIEVTSDPVVLVHDAETCRSQLEVMYRLIDFDDVVKRFGPIKSIIGECRLAGAAAGEQPA